MRGLSDRGISLVRGWINFLTESFINCNLHLTLFWHTIDEDDKGEVNRSHCISLEKFKGRGHFGDLSIDRRENIVKDLSLECCVKVRAHLNTCKCKSANSNSAFKLSLEIALNGFS
jgi:hypothetical protein